MSAPGGEQLEPNAAPFPRSHWGTLVWSWAPVVALMTAIFVASGTPNLTALPGGLSDHLWHFMAYAALGGLAFRAFARSSWSGVSAGRACLAWLLAAGYGLTDEFHQSFVPGRFPAVDDWIADAFGAGVAILVILVAAIGRALEDRKV